MSSGNGKVIVIAYGWPSYKDGYSIALQSSIEQYMRYYSRVLWVGLTNHPFQENRSSYPNVDWRHIPVNRASLWQRYLRSLLTPLPAITMQYMSRQVRRDFTSCLLPGCEQHEGIIFEDLAPSCLAFLTKRICPNTPIAIRSLNLTVKAFENFAHRGGLLHRLVWQLEIKKIESFEKRVCGFVDRFWCISEQEAELYSKMLQVKCDGVFGVSLNSERYTQISSGDIFTILYLGGVDLRKREGIAAFVNSAWPKIRKLYPKARFLLAGRNTECFTNMKMGISGIGFCDDELHFLGKGSIFVNPQEDGAGIKLKSIVAMLSGKALVSTKIGIEGVIGQPGKHFFVANTAEDLANLVIELLKDPEQAVKAGQQARRLASEVYTMANLSRSVAPLLEDFSNLASPSNV